MDYIKCDIMSNIFIVTILFKVRKMSKKYVYMYINIFLLIHKLRITTNEITNLNNKPLNYIQILSDERC